MRSPRTRSLLALCSLSLCACWGHHTADEEVIQVEPNVAFDAGEEPSTDDDSNSTSSSESNSESNSNSDTTSEPSKSPSGSAKDAGAASACANATDPLSALLCTAGLGGSGSTSIEDIINGFLGGGMEGMSCSGITDPIARILCTTTGTGGGGIEGLLNGFLGDGGIGSVFADGGIERVVTDTLVQVVRGLIDDFIGALIAPFDRDGGSGGFFGGFGDGGWGGFGGLRRDAGADASSGYSNKARPAELSRSTEECASVSKDDLLTRLICARQKLDQL
jgi:hypothetical protein